MKILIAFTLTLATATAFTLQEKPVFLEDLVVDDVQGLEGRITNGYKAKPGQFPHQAGLSLKRGSGSSWCGGSVIAKNWVLTAAHCTDGVTSAIVYLGSTTRTVAKVSYTVYSTSIHQHTGYKASTLANDLSLIEIPAVSYSVDIQPIRLPAKSSSYPSYAGVKVIASGWGRTSDGSSASSALNYAYLTVITNDLCARTYGSSVITSNTLCVATPSGTSTCQGDSGGPLVTEENILIGVTSFVSTAGCKSGYPAGFVRVTSYLDWIKGISSISY